MGVYFNRVKSYFYLSVKFKENYEGLAYRVCETDYEICMQMLIAVKIKFNEAIWGS